MKFNIRFITSEATVVAQFNLIEFIDREQALDFAVGVQELLEQTQVETLPIVTAVQPIRPISEFYEEIEQAS